MQVLEIIIVSYLGLVIGSFLAAWSYRLPRSKSISNSKGRSACPKCGHAIFWYDNIPLLSYLVLRGRCRNCNKKISLRYPLIEFSTLLIYLLIYFYRPTILANIYPLPYLLFVATLLIMIFVVDVEHMIIPDELVFAGIFVTFLLFLITGSQSLFPNFLAGFAISILLLSINLLTRGRGMGLGDVKLAVFMGAILGLELSIIWIFLSFIIGGIFAFLLIIFRLARLADRVPFAPFLIIGFAVTIFLNAENFPFWFF